MKFRLDEMESVRHGFAYEDPALGPRRDQRDIAHPVTPDPAVLGVLAGRRVIADRLDQELGIHFSAITARRGRRAER